MNRRFAARNDFASPAGGREDPLAELARIVNRNDPFNDLFNEARTAPQPQRVEPPMAAPPAAAPFEGDLRGSYDPHQDDPRQTQRFRGQAAPSYGIATYDEAPVPANSQAPVRSAAGHPHAEDDLPESDRYAPAPAYDDAYGAQGQSYELYEQAAGYYENGETGVADDDIRAAPYVPEEDVGRGYQQGRRGLSSVAVIAVVAALAGVGGGAYAWKSGLFERGGMVAANGEPPLIIASKEPAKIKPETPAPDAPPATKEIFDRVAPEEAGVPERILPREEQPVAVTIAPPAEQPRVVQTTPVTEPTGAVTQPLPPAPAAADPQPAPPTRSIAAATPPSTNPHEPRRVKTVKVLSDGTIVTGEAPAMPPPEMGVPSLAVPQSPVDPDQVAAAPEPATEEPAAATPQAAPKPAPVPPVRPKKVPTAPVKPAAAEPAPATPQQTQVAAVEAPQPAAPAAGNGAFVVQISSQKSQAEAMAAYQAVQRKFPSVMSGMKPSIQKAEVGDKGTFYRVRVGGWAARDQATAFCVKLKAAGGDCVVTRG